MTYRNPFARFMDNNIGALTTNSVTYSSQLAANPFTYALNPFRSQPWITTGNFDITASNKNVYINDGSNKTVVLTIASYATGTLMAAHIQTQLNASSSGWACTYSTTTYCFTIGNSGSVTLRLSQTSNAAWNALGFFTSSDLTGTSFAADRQANHTSEYCVFDLGYSANILAFAVISPAALVFPISAYATIKLEGNNINDFTAAPLSLTLTRYDGGLFLFLDDQTDTNYRYWKFSWIDNYNVNGPQFQIANIYLGDYQYFTNRPIARGYDKTIMDPSIISKSESGVRYFNNKNKYSTFESLPLEILERGNKDYLETLFQRKGLTVPFYFSVDPLNQYTTSLDELTRYVYFAKEPKFKHIQRDQFTTSLDLMEAI